MLLQHLEQMHAAGELVLFTPEAAGARPAWMADVTVVPIARSRLISAVLRAAFSGLPLQEAYYSSRVGAAALAREHARTPFNVVYVDMLRMAGTLAALPGDSQSGPRIVIDFDDRLSHRYAQMRALAAPNLLGSRAQDFPPVVRRIARAVGRAVLGIEAARMRRREVYWARRGDYGVFSAPGEARDFAAEMGSDAFGHAPLLPAEHAPAAFDEHRPARLIFIGNLRNSQGLETFRLLEAAMQARLRDGHDVPTLHIFGMHDAVVVPDVLRDRIVFHGFVDTLASVAAEPSVLLAPITFGTGIKTKIFDALAVGIVPVTTPRGIEGLEVKSDREVSVVPDADDVLAAGVALLNDPARFAAMRRAGLTFVATEHSPARAAQSYRRMLGA